MDALRLFFARATAPVHHTFVPHTLKYRKPYVLFKKRGCAFHGARPDRADAGVNDV
jgi:hypothetical protein